MDAYAARNMSYGLLDAIVSTTAVLAGVASADQGRRAVLVTGFILVLFEALSMGFGAALSDEHFEMAERSGARPSPSRKWQSAGVMFAAYLLTGVVLLAPYVLLPDPARATPWSIGIGATLMFALVRSFQGPAKAAVATLAGVIIMALSVLVGRGLGA